jgi:small subunit ribosomal protein S8
MTMSDPIADMVIRIKNATNAKHTLVDMPGSKFKTRIAKILKDEGYIQDFKVSDLKVGQKLEIVLKFDQSGLPVIHGIKKISKPGLRRYTSKADLPKVMGGLGTAILSTSSGVMTERVARNKGVGGEVIAYVW